jgi:signal transduction histidine kinase
VHRSVLLAGAFAALLLVIGTSAFAVWTNARRAQEHVAQLQRAHLEARTALTVIRANIYQAEILTRDYLLDANTAHAPEYIAQITSIRNKTEEALHTLEASGEDGDQRAVVRQLRRELSTYWDPTDVVLDWTPAEKRAQRSQMLRQRVKRRQEAFALAAQVERIISDNFTRERSRITTADQEFRSSLGWITAVALLLGFGIAGVTLMRMVALERQSRTAELELRLLSGQIRTAQEQERKYLSRELHDQVGQMLTGLRMELTSMARLLADSESELSSRIARSKGTVEQTLRIVRNIAMLLRPSMLDDLGLTPALAWLLKEMSRSSGMEIKSDIDNAVDSLPDPYRTCIYRVIQEALTNASRHSGARSAEVKLQAVGAWVVGSVSDDGKGFDPALTRRRGLGLLGMEERVRELGGSIRVVSAPGRGVRVEIRLPRPAPAGLEQPAAKDGRLRDELAGIEASAGSRS